MSSPVVLIVDDDALTLRAYQRLLRDGGYLLRIATSGDEALRLLQEDTAVVIADLVMPGMDGVAFLAEVRKRLPNAVRIAITGRPDYNAIMACINAANAWRYLVKPFNEEEFKHAVAKACEHYSLGAAKEQARRENISQLERELAIRTKLAEYVHRDVLNRILASEPNADLPAGHQTVTAMFMDLRESTRLIQRLAADQMVQLLNSLFVVAGESVLEQRGLIDKYIGDGLFAVFGAPHPLDDHASRAVRAALGIRSRLSALNEQLRQRLGVEARVGFGLSSGPVIAGTLGAGHTKREYTVIGAPVNVANRVEQLTKGRDNAVFVSQSTKDLLGAEFECETLGAKQLPGILEPVEIFEVLRCIAPSNA